MSKPNEMAELWRELGLVDVEQTSLLIRMKFSNRMLFSTSAHPADAGEEFVFGSVVCQRFPTWRSFRAIKENLVPICVIHQRITTIIFIPLE